MELQDAEQAELFVQEVFISSPQRLRHVLIIAEMVRQSARDINELNPGANVDERLAYLAGLLHDIGYAAAAVKTGFHPLDGYHFLCRCGAQRIAERIVAHSSSPEEAELLGLRLPHYEDDVAAKLVTYWDMQVKQGGEIVGYDARYRDILARYGEESITGRAHIMARPRIETLIAGINRLLRNIPD